MDASIWFGILQLTAVVVVLVLLYRPLGDYIAHVFTSARDLRVERGVYRLIGVDSSSEQTWRAYARGVLTFSVVGVLLVYGLQRLQAFLRSPSDSRRCRRACRSTPPPRSWRTPTGSPTPRADRGLHRAARGPHGAELRLGRSRPHDRDRADPRSRPSRFDHHRQLLGRPDPRPRAHPAADRPDRRGGASRRRRDPELRRLHRHHHRLRWHPDHPRRSGRLAGGDQAPGHERRRLLQRQLRASLREPDRLHEPAAGAPDPRDPVLPAPRLRAHGRRPPPGLRDRRRDGHDLPGVDLHALGARTRRPRHRTRTRRSGDGGQGGALRHPGLDAVRKRQHPHIDGCGQLDARFVHSARRDDADAEHDARRGRPRRRRLGPVRHARARDHRGVRRRTARRPHPGVPRQADRSAGDQAREPVHPGDPDTRAGRHRAELRRSRHPRRRGVHEHPEPGRARHERGALRVHLGVEQQRLRVRRTHREHPVVQHRARYRDAARTLPADRARAGPGRLVRRTGAHPRHIRHPAHAPTAVRRPAPRRDRHRHRAHLLPRARTGTLAEGLV